MKIDFHSHGKLAKKLHFSKEYTRLSLSIAKKSGLDCIAMTEHFNTSEFDKLYDFIISSSNKDYSSLIFENGLRIFPGIEVDIKENWHIQVIGHYEDIFYLRDELKDNMEKENFISAKGLFDKCQNKNLLIGAAHPFRSSREKEDLSDDIMEKFDFFDLNGKDIAVDGDEIIEKTRALAEKFNKPYLTGSDTHHPLQFGIVNTEFDKDISKIDDLKDAIKSRSYKINISEKIKEKTYLAKYVKRLLKEIDNLDGDYVKWAFDENIYDIFQ